MQLDYSGVPGKTGGPDRRQCSGFGDFVEYMSRLRHLAFTVIHRRTPFHRVGQVSASLNLLTWIGAHTKTLRSATAVLVLPLAHPVLVAERPLPSICCRAAV